MKLQRILITLIAITYIAIYRMWLTCHSLYEKFQFKMSDVSLKINEAAYSDIGYDHTVSRILHNKVSVGGSELLTKYLHFWDIHFQAVLFTLVGSFGIIYGFWHLAKKRKRHPFSAFVILFLLIMPFMELFKIPLPFFVTFSLFAIPFYVFSLFGLWQFMQQFKRKGVIIVGVLLVISIWYFFVFQKDIFTYFCYNK